MCQPRDQCLGVSRDAGASLSASTLQARPFSTVMNRAAIRR